MEYFSFIIITCIFLYLCHYSYNHIYSHITLISDYEKNVCYRNVEQIHQCCDDNANDNNS